jgi:hypothetical protein
MAMASIREQQNSERKCSASGAESDFHLHGQDHPSGATGFGVPTYYPVFMVKSMQSRTTNQWQPECHFTWKD